MIVITIATEERRGPAGRGPRSPFLLRRSHVKYSPLIGTTLLAAGLLSGPAAAQQKEAPKGDKASASDYKLVKDLMESRAKYQASLEQLRAFYLGAGDVEKARWAEE